MQKTRLGISVGLLGAGVCFLGLVGGYLVTAILAGYILLFEENEWLKKNSVKVISFMILVSFANVVLNLIPNIINVINNFVGIFGGNFSLVILIQIVATLTSMLDVVEKLVLISLGIKAVNQGTVAIPIVDSLVKKYMR